MLQSMFVVEVHYVKHASCDKRPTDGSAVRRAQKTEGGGAGQLFDAGWQRPPTTLHQAYHTAAVSARPLPSPTPSIWRYPVDCVK